MSELDLTDEQWDALEPALIDAVLALRPEPAHEWKPGDWCQTGMVLLVDEEDQEMVAVRWNGDQWHLRVAWEPMSICVESDPPESWVAAGRPGAVDHTSLTDPHTNLTDPVGDSPDPVDADLDHISGRENTGPVEQWRNVYVVNGKTRPNDAIHESREAADRLALKHDRVGIQRRREVGDWVDVPLDPVGDSPDWDAIAEQIHDTLWTLPSWNQELSRVRGAYTAAVEAVVGPLLAEKDERIGDCEQALEMTEERDNARIARLEQWKREALEVMAGWAVVENMMPTEAKDLGRSWSDVVASRILELEAEAPDWQDAEVMLSYSEGFVARVLGPAPASDEGQMAFRARPEGDSNE